MVQEILKAIEGLPVDEKRAAQSEYLELVFMAGDMARWDEKIASVLGAAVKPQGQKPSKDDEAITGNYGGIGQDQVLYRKDANGGTCVAMMWPWRDGDHVTLKVATLSAAPAAAAPEVKSAAPAGPGPLVWVVISILAVAAVLVGIYVMM